MKREDRKLFIKICMLSIAFCLWFWLGFIARGGFKC